MSDRRIQGAQGFKQQPEFDEIDEPVVGVLGGMGPAATIDFLAKLTAATPASRDQEHLRLVIWSNPRVPDRSSALLGEGPDPRPLLREGIAHLVEAGAQLLAVPCNSAHAFVPRLANDAGIQLVDMVTATVERTLSLHDVGAVGLLATSGTVASSIYQDRYASAGIGCLKPKHEEQLRVMQAIRAVKAGDTGSAPRDEVFAVASSLIERGAQALVAACTELPLLLQRTLDGRPVIDTTQALVDEVLSTVRGGGSGLQPSP